MKPLLRLSLMPFALTFFGCTSLGITDQATVEIDASEGKKNELEIASFPAQLRGAYVYTGADGKKSVCAEPFTDVAVSRSLDATANLVNNLSSALNQSTNVSTQRARNQSDAYNRSRSITHSENSTTQNYSGNSSDDIELENTYGNSFGGNSSAQQSINLGLKTVNEIVTLEGRTQFVLLAREMLFRTCEAAANGQMVNENSPVAKQHALVFEALTKMIETQKVKEEAAKEKAKAEKAKAVAAAAEKLDPEILKTALSDGIGSVLGDQYIDELETCLEKAKDDKAKLKCKTEYKDKLKKLNGAL